MDHPIIFYDGVCGLCDGLVQFVLRHDRNAVFRFAPLQSEFARNTLTPRGFDPSDLETVHVFAGDGVVTRGRATLFVLTRLNQPWSGIAVLLGILPTPVLDLGYRILARFRYRLFGQYDACPVPDPRWKGRFIKTEGI